MSRHIQTITMKELLPSSISSDEKINGLSEALSSELRKITESLEKILFYPNISKLPENIIDVLAEQFQVSFYDILGLNLKTKRELVENAILWNKTKGTKAVLQEMISTLYDSNCIVQEWFEYGGKPYYFKLFIDNVTFDEKSLEILADIINELKNVRSHLDYIAINLIIEANLYVGGTIIKNNKSFVKTDMIKTFNYSQFIGSLVIVNRETFVKGSEMIIE